MFLLIIKTSVISPTGACPSPVPTIKLVNVDAFIVSAFIYIKLCLSFAIIIHFTRLKLSFIVLNFSGRLSAHIVPHNPTRFYLSNISQIERIILKQTNK